MKERDFLKKAVKARQLEIVEASENIYESYLKKSDNCLKAAELLIANGLYENSVSDSYYAIYNSITALLRKVGIKCENHAVSISLLETLFSETVLRDIASKARESRIDSQYEIDVSASKAKAVELQCRAENFVTAVRMVSRKLTNEKSEKIRQKLGGIIG
jgi:uncharacterized protein (UPF0332 family)